MRVAAWRPSAASHITRLAEVPFPYPVALGVASLSHDENRRDLVFSHRLFFQLNYCAEHGMPLFPAIARESPESALPGSVWFSLSHRRSGSIRFFSLGRTAEQERCNRENQLETTYWLS